MKYNINIIVSIFLGFLIFLIFSQGCGEIIIEEEPESEVKVVIEEEIIPSDPPIIQNKVLIYMGTVSWISLDAAREQAEKIELKLEDEGIQVDITKNESKVEEWIRNTRNDKIVDIFIVHGVMPSEVYPATRYLTNHSLIEHWIESTDGNMILNLSDYLGYYSDGDIHQGWENINGRWEEERAGLENGEKCLQSLMDNKNIRRRRNYTEVFPTPSGKEFLPSLKPFISNRPFDLDKIRGTRWKAEAIFGLASDENRADPVILRDRNLGRIGIACMIPFEKNNLKGDVAIEMILYILNK